jgi:UDP-N-acetyl-alpha-D-muramoyl-L-alanyl-L-glutamate epimerase
MKNFILLRKKYPKFVYENFGYKISNNDLQIVFSFSIKPSAVATLRARPDIKFSPKITIKNIDKKRISKIGKNALDNFIFHAGLMEIPSYWKATCSPKIEIKTGYLNKEQIDWWKKLFVNGLGQFYYENKIDFTKPDLVKIIPSSVKKFKPFSGELKDAYLVPFAGGRDSIVTLEKLKEKHSLEKISLFTVNPIKKIQDAARVSKIKKQIIVKREIDKKLLELNKDGYLNGHTPFTSLLSFLSVFCAVIFDYKNIAFSNEKSSNEGNVRYLGKIINHQWAKTSKFEKEFAYYCKKFLAKEINYYSFIRKYGELEISEMLSKYKQYFPVFSSCNAGMRINSAGQLQSKKRWCGNCPKCLFVYLSLYPYLSATERIEIFGKDFFESSINASGRLQIIKAFLGEKNAVKPFECVGTKKESIEAIKLSVKKAKKEGKIPFILKHFITELK